MHFKLQAALACLVSISLFISGCSSPPQPPPIQRLANELHEQDLGTLVRETEWAYVEGAAVKAEWTFDEDDLKGWETVRTIVDLRAEDGALRGSAVGVERGLATNIKFTAGGLDYLRLRVATERGGNGRLYWATRQRPVFEESHSVPFTLASGSDMRDVLLPVGGHPGWEGDVFRIRLDLPPDSGDFAIDDIRIHEARTQRSASFQQLNGTIGKAVVDDDSRLSLFAFPPHDIPWTITTEPGSILSFSYGILAEVWGRPSNQASFHVLASSGDEEPREIFATTLSPRDTPDDQGWQQATIELPKTDSGELQLIFRTETAGSDQETNPYAFAVWGNPRVIAKREDVKQPNIVLISLDALRADRIGVYGYPLATTPNLDRLASEAIVFENAVSQSPWSLPSYASLFTSLYPSMIGVTEMSQILPQDAATLARFLRDAGYATVAFTAGGFAGRHWGMDRGFERFWEGSKVEDLSARLEQWSGSAPEEPFFLYLHSYELHDYFRAPDAHVQAAEDLHGPLILPESIYRSLILEGGENLTSEQIQELSKLYDGALRVMDDWLGRWLEQLSSQGVLDNAVIVVFSDHGEAFGEHDGIVHHGGSLYEDLVHVPLVIRYPAPEGSDTQGRVGAVVELVDLLPTLLELAGLAPPATIQGHSLVPYLLRVGAHQSGGGKHALGLSEQPLKGKIAFRRQTEKYIYTSATGFCPATATRRPGGLYCEELFDMSTRPVESRSLADDEQRLGPIRDDFLATYLTSTPGLRLVARGGSTEETTLTLRFSEAPSLPVSEGMYLESSDRVDSDTFELHLPPGDLDLMAWAIPYDEAWRQTELMIDAPTDGTPRQLLMGPDCRTSLPFGRITLSRVLAAEGSEITLPGVASEPAFCLVYTPKVFSQPGLSQPSEEVIERLRALGYVDG